MTSRHHNAGPSTAGAIDHDLIEAVRAGDEAAFMTLVDRYHASMVRLARIYVHDRAVAEEIAQEAWLGVLQGLRRFEGRSSLKTWIFRILTNIAKTRATREGRSVPFSALWRPEAEPVEPAVEPDQFQTSGRFKGHWISHPRSWEGLPEDRLLSEETCDVIRSALAALPPMQREVITLRDVEQWTGEEVCNVLGISETNQRVLLHRARSKVRRVLDQYLNERD